MKDKRAKIIIAKVAKKQIEQKFRSVAEAITKTCSNRKGRNGLGIKRQSFQSLLGLPEAVGIAGTNHYYTVKIGK